MIKYEKWINENTPENSYGKCGEYTNKMIKTFPKLKRVRGHYNCAILGRREHWWCVDDDGNIIDPTISQFPTRPPIASYEPWIQGDPEPTGKCPNCGEYCYDHNFCCSDLCKKLYVSYLNDACKM